MTKTGGGAGTQTRRGDVGGGNDSEKRTATADSHGDEESRSADAVRAEVKKTISAIY